MNWEQPAAALAAAVTHPASRWRGPVAGIPRHRFVPRWWHRGPDGWTRHDGRADPEQWQAAAYADRSVITSVAGQHADLAEDDDHPTGRPTSSATLPSLVVRMFQHARLGDDDELLDVGTGSGYGAALAAYRLGERQVTSVDVDPYLVDAARERLAGICLSPRLETVDATGELPGTFDRIVATVAVRPIPASWLAALRTGGRLVTTLAGTSLIVTAEKQPDGGAKGVIEWDRAGFMHARHDAGDYPPGVGELLDAARDAVSDDVTISPYPVVDVANAWDLASMLDLAAPGIEHHYSEDGEHRVALMAHPDGSWARASGRGDRLPTVYQGGPRRLWALLDDVRGYWLHHGELPVRGSRVFIKPDGTTTLARGKWHVRLTPT
ncbi:methyltransferase domain-containing protein [Streptomyces litchfieldiae]|uniref:Protein-L-isoaspartate O-methyltransferase n=1 Tax=Streptomyces litchfieldiae TaxID=3075543 RepID=A0ABU2MYP4_9ACTN|nr:methyltransferase domain-containing protein [Streptomyces sp. DSM 44938]MDT0346744.1 50S ribosomal protein L11 methyltransferase [Streptomyces sp. DSM 44938]